MSAGGISYSGITNYGKCTLPSVESWNTNMNILRDPPKSVTTRRIDKVGETNSLNELAGESGDRICEGISLYARGVNPCVSVDYSNNGNNGGQKSGGFFGNKIGVGQSFLPYRIMRDGAFRPPILSPFDLLPLSRMPRVNTKAFSNPGFTDFSKTLQSEGSYRQIKESTLNCSIRPTATYRLDSHIEEPFEVKYVIKNPVKFDIRAGETGIKTYDITMQDVNEPTKEINTSPLYATNVYTNFSGETFRDNVDNSHMNTEPYIQDTLHSYVKSKPSRSIQISSIEDIFDVDVRTKDAMNISYTTLKTGYTKEDISDVDVDGRTKDVTNISYTPLKTGYTKEDIFDVDVDGRIKDVTNISYTPLKTSYTKEDNINTDMELQRRVIATSMATNKQRDIYYKPEHEYQLEQKRNRPIAEVVTNIGTTQHQDTDLNSREYRLKPTISAGGISGRGQMPVQNMNSDIKLAESIQHERNRKVLEMQLGRQ